MLGPTVVAAVAVKAFIDSLLEVIVGSGIRDSAVSVAITNVFLARGIVRVPTCTVELLEQALVMSWLVSLSHAYSRRRLVDELLAESMAATMALTIVRRSFAGHLEQRRRRGRGRHS